MSRGPPSFTSTAARKCPWRVGLRVLSWTAKTVDLLGLRVHMVREVLLGSGKLFEKALDLREDTFRDDGRCLIEIQPRNGPAVGNANGHRIGAHGFGPVVHLSTPGSGTVRAVCSAELE
eukprot:CAMPEP_0114676786 /NCGR_PEP_ID=MMETSP0191-20121206/49700_1 /TAXON_ID=126664 /ORGANISM="Sorites sp." /LENGTH=118 /DNA_ID=CAMNT_0001948365 /DNA_START=85 /DNA_END=438 /DNA_ORIENTATION=+